MKVFKHGRKTPLVPTLTRPFPNGPLNAGSWLGTKNASICIIVSNQQTACPEFFSCVCTQWLLSHHTCPICSPKKCTQSGNFQFDINTVHFKILSTWQLKHGNMCMGILKTLFRKIQAWAAYHTYLNFHWSHLHKCYLRYLMIGHTNWICSVQIGMFLLLASEMFSCVIGISFFSS